jgi:replicative DNA helicase
MADDEWTRFARRMSEIADALLVLGRPKDRDITALAEHISDLASTGTLLVVIDPLHMAVARRDLPYENREREPRSSDA